MSQQQTAFPYNRPSLSASGKWETIAEPGMYLRDWFAGQALRSIMREEEIGQAVGEGVYDFDTVAEASYLMADAMMKARKK